MKRSEPSKKRSRNNYRRRQAVRTAKMKVKIRKIRKVKEARVATAARAKRTKKSKSKKRRSA